VPRRSRPIDDIEQLCIEFVDRADIVLVLYNGSAGWASQRLEGICETELRVALDRAPYKVRIIRLPETRSRKRIDVEFREFVAGQGVWMSLEVDTYEGIRDEARQSAASRRRGDGSRTRTTGRPPLRERARRGASLAQLDFRARAESMRKATAEVLIEAHGGHDVGDAGGVGLVELEVREDPAPLPGDAVPPAMSVPAVREMVGQPFLRTMSPPIACATAQPVPFTSSPASRVSARRRPPDSSASPTP